jgi:hypothetical protein
MLHTPPPVATRGPDDTRRDAAGRPSGQLRAGSDG